MIGPISWHHSDNGNRNYDDNYDADGDGNDNGDPDDDANGDIYYGNYNGDPDDDGNGDVPSPISPASGQQRVAWACKELLTNALLTNTIIQRTPRQHIIDKHNISFVVHEHTDAI